MLKSLFVCLFLRGIRKMGEKQKKDKTERGTRLGRRTREVTVKWNQMTALRFQTGERDIRHPRPPFGAPMPALNDLENKLTCTNPRGLCVLHITLFHLKPLVSNTDINKQTHNATQWQTKKSNRNKDTTNTAPDSG